MTFSYRRLAHRLPSMTCSICDLLLKPPVKGIETIGHDSLPAQPYRGASVGPDLGRWRGQTKRREAEWRQRRWQIRERRTEECDAGGGITGKGGQVCAWPWTSDWAERTGTVNQKALFRPLDQQPKGQMGQFQERWLNTGDQTPKNV